MNTIAHEYTELETKTKFTVQLSDIHIAYKADNLYGTPLLKLQV